MKLSSIDLNILVALDAILSERNVSRAAERLGRSQPAASHALSRARQLFDDPLLVRVGSSFELTARARAIAPRIHRLLGELGAVLDVRKDFDPAGVESIAIGATDYVGFVLLPHVMRILRETAPNVVVRVRTVEGRDALDPLASGTLDLALGAFPHIPAGLKTEELFTEQFVCLLRKDHPSIGTRMSIDEFAALGHVLVISPSDGQGPVDEALARTGRHRHIAAYVPQFLVAPSIVAETDLVLTTGKRIAERVAPALDLHIVPAPVTLKPFVVRMIWHARTENDSVGRWLRATLRTATAQLLQREAVSRVRGRKAGTARRARPSS